jgi:predicted dehydrogenase
VSLRIAVVGAGLMGQLHARTVAQGDTTILSAVVELDEDVGRDVAGRFGASRFRTVEDALEDDGIDAYIVALPDRMHVDASIALLRAGKPVLLEKPMAHDLEGARAIARAAAASGARLLVGHVLRFDPRYATAARAVADGSIGDPLHASAGRISSRSFGTRLNGASSVLFYLGIHDVDAIQWVTGRSIHRVYSRAVSQLMPSLGVACEDAVVSVVDFDGGCVGQLFNAWTRATDDPVAIDGRLEVFGTHGRVEVDARDHGVRVFGEGGMRFPDGLHWPTVNGLIQGDLAAEIAHFARAVLDDAPFVFSVDEAIRGVAVNDAILRSVASGEPEDVETI